jgi:tetratricopeptide (TPR) repeat protein
MSKWRNILKTFTYSILMLCVVNGFAQNDKLNRAQQLLQSKNADMARLAIDSVIVHPETKGDFVAWTTRAYIYFEIYKRNDKLKLNSSLRDTILSSLKTSGTLKPDETFATNNKKLLSNIAAGYFNLSKLLLMDSVNYSRSIVAYNKFKENFAIAEPGTNFTARDIEYYLAVGSVYSDIFNKDNKNSGAQDIAKIALLKVLDIQPENPSANINLGIMYYNQAVNLGKGLDYGADFSQIDVVQENIIKLAKQAEQFIIKVYKVDNKNVKAVEALHSIYKMLNDKPKEEEFKKKCKELNIKID